MTERTSASASASSPGRADSRQRAGERKVSSTGATSRVPMASPTHHQSHAPAARSSGMTLPGRRLATPKLALTSGKHNAAPKSPRTSRLRRSAGCTRMRSNSSSPTRAPSVFPVAIARATGAPTPVS